MEGTVGLAERILLEVPVLLRATAVRAEFQLQVVSLGKAPALFNQHHIRQVTLRRQVVRRKSEVLAEVAERLPEHLLALVQLAVRGVREVLVQLPTRRVLLATTQTQ
jgi:hypothetical protein